MIPMTVQAKSDCLASCSVDLNANSHDYHANGVLAEHRLETVLIVWQKVYNYNHQIIPDINCLGSNKRFSRRVSYETWMPF